MKSQCWIAYIKRPKAKKRGLHHGAKHNKKAKKAVLLLGVLCILLLTAGGWLYLSAQKVNSSPDDPLALDDNATMGVLPAIDMEQRQAKLQQQLDEGMIAFSINTNPVFATGGSEGNLMLENPANNAKLLMAEIYIDSTQEMIYQRKLFPWQYFSVR